MDFVHDQTAMETKIRNLTIADTFAQFSPAIGARYRSSCEDSCILGARSASGTSRSRTSEG